MCYPIFNLEAAINLAKFAHTGQQDYSGQDYVFHPLIVMRSINNATEIEQIAAVLHDVVEDTKVTIDMLKALGCPQEAIDIIKLVSRDKNTQTYAEFIENIANSENLSAIKLKIADLSHNMSPERTKHLPPEKKGVINRYQKAMIVLLNAQDKFLQLEIKDGINCLN